MDPYPYEDELANAMTHGISALVFLVLTPLLIAYAVQTRNTGKIIGTTFFAFGLLAVYFSSTVFHAIPNKFPKDALHYLDLISIYFLIAGSYTAFILICLKDKLGFFLLALIWVISFAGIQLTIFFPGISFLYSLILYLALGWIGILIFKPLFRQVSRKVFLFLVLGGCSYTFGTYFYYHDYVTYYHAIWHLFVFNGSLLHWVALFLAVKGRND